MPVIDTVEALRARYKKPGQRALQKELKHLDPHCRDFIALSPFLVIASSSDNGQLDTSPRGGDAGFVKVLDNHTLAIPDWPGNNRLDTFVNVIETGAISLIFLIPGITETLRVNGRARLSDDERLIDLCIDAERRPRLVIEVTVEQAFLHCAKAVMRSHLWDPDRHVDRGRLPTMARMLKSHTGLDVEDETHEEMLTRYNQVLY